MTVLGIDISRWQNNITTPQVMDFAKAKQAGANFAFIKASQATWKDRDFVMNWANCKAANLPRGAYHFMDWTTSAANQARYFASVLVDDPGELPPVADFEYRKGAPVKAKATEELYSFVSNVEQALGRQVMIYTAPYYWREFFSGAHANHFADRPLWIAHYGVSRPTVPAPWNVWTFWQYSAKGDGRLFGAESLDIDLDYYNGTLDQFNAAFNLTHEPTVLERLTAIEARVTALEGK